MLQQNCFFQLYSHLKALLSNGSAEPCVEYVPRSRIDTTSSIGSPRECQCAFSHLLVGVITVANGQKTDSSHAILVKITSNNPGTAMAAHAPSPAGYVTVLRSHDNLVMSRAERRVPAIALRTCIGRFPTLCPRR